MTTKNLTLRLDTDIRAQLEAIAECEYRTLANQINAFLRQSIKQYLEKNHLEFQKASYSEDDNSLKLVSEGSMPF